MGFFDVLSGIAKSGFGLLQKEMARQDQRQGRSNGHRSTKEEFRRNTSGMEKRPEDFSYRAHVSLSRAKTSAPGEP